MTDHLEDLLTAHAWVVGIEGEVEKATKGKFSAEEWQQWLNGRAQAEAALKRCIDRVAPLPLDK